MREKDGYMCLCVCVGERVREKERESERERERVREKERERGEALICFDLRVTSNKRPCPIGTKLVRKKIGKS